MEELRKKGNKCQICTRCGACLGEKKGLQVLMGSAESSGNGTEKWKKFVSESLDGRKTWYACIDIGTTTLAMELYNDQGEVVTNLGLLNPQIVCGADVISRIVMASTQEGLTRLQSLIRRELAKGLAEFHRLLPKGYTLRVWAAGNTVMSYLLMGYEPRELGEAPFTQSHCKEVELLKIGQDLVHLLPCLSAYIGGDLVAGYLWTESLLENKSQSPEKQQKKMDEFSVEYQEDDAVSISYPYLLLDLGTNAEMLLVTEDKIYATSAAAGTAFEGGSKDTFGADFIHLLAECLREGYVDLDGLLKEPFFEAGITVGGRVLTQERIRELQLAKAAVATGIEVLLQEVDLPIHYVIISGGFGYFLKVEDMVSIGMLPAAFADRTISGGNTSLQGLLQMNAIQNASPMVSWEDGKQTSDRMVKKEVQVISLPDREDFQECYVNHMRLESF